MADKILTVDQLIKVLEGRKYKWSQVHHTYQPDHADFNGKNHLALQQGMRNYHVNVRGWYDIGQHVTLMPDGLFVTGRDFDDDKVDFDDIPAGIAGYNTGAFMVEMLGNFDKGHDKLEGKQLDAMVKLQHYLTTKCGATVMFHREHAPKTCPGTGIDKDEFMKLVKNFGGKTVDTPKPVEKPKQQGDVQIGNIQRYLIGKYGVKIEADGYYGPATKKAFVIALQKELNKQYDAKLTVDGLFGPKTKVASPIVRIGTKGNITYLIQAKLNCLGYNTKGIDGIFGKNSANAVLSFQKDNKLGQDGIAGPNTIEKLFK